MPEPVLQPLAPGQVMRIGPTAGTGTPTRDYGIGATDLCEFMEFPTERRAGLRRQLRRPGRRLRRLVLADRAAGRHVSVDDPDGVRYTGVTGINEPLLADPTPAGDSQLPAGVVQINRQNYLLVTTTKDLVPQNSRLVKAEPAQGLWQTLPGSARDAAYAGGRQSQISGYYDPIPTPDVTDRVGVHRRRQLRPQPTGGAVSGRTGELRRPVPVAGLGAWS